MKKYFKVLSFFLIIGIMMQSCKEELNVPQTKKVGSPKKTARMNRNSYNQLQDELDALDLSYGLPSVSEISEYEDWDFTYIGSYWNVAAQDALGACAGIGAGAILSGGNPVVAGITGAVVGAICSIAEYKKGENSNNNGGMQTVINSNNPFIYSTQENRFDYGGNAPIGSEIGELHNCLVSEILADIDSISMSTPAGLLAYAYSTDFTTLNTHFTSQQVSDLQTYLYENETDILDYLENQNISMLSQECPDESSIIKHYAYVISQSTEIFDRFQYTMDFMHIIDYAYQTERISEESAILINGTISTFYCSKTAWNYIQPDPFFANTFVIRNGTTWQLTRDANLLMNVLHNNPVQFVGFPYIENDTIKRIYVYANSPYNTMLPDNDMILSSLFEDEYYTNTATTTQFMENYWACQPIATGCYPILPATGYTDYIFIDLEHGSDIQNN